MGIKLPESSLQEIEALHRIKMNQLAKVIGDVLNAEIGREGEFEVSEGEPEYGFMLLVFPFGDAGPDARMNFISNAQRADMIAAMEEFLRNLCNEPTTVRFPRSAR